MSEQDVTQMDESSEATLDSLDIAELRRFAKLFKITAQRDWKKEDFVKAIQARQEATRLNEEADALSSPEGSPADKDALKPGEARIVIHRDPTPGSANSPVPVGLNARMMLFPRGVPVVVPIEYVNVLADAKEVRMRQKEAPSLNNPEGVVVQEEIQSYPFQVLEMIPRKPGSKFHSSIDQRADLSRRKEEFRKVHNKWPTSGELLEFEHTKREDARLERKLKMER